MNTIIDPKDWEEADSNDDWEDLSDDYWNSEEGQQHAENID